MCSVYPRHKLPMIWNVIPYIFLRFLVVPWFHFTSYFNPALRRSSNVSCIEIIYRLFHYWPFKWYRHFNWVYPTDLPHDLPHPSSTTNIYIRRYGDERQNCVAGFEIFASMASLSDWLFHANTDIFIACQCSYLRPPSSSKLCYIVRARSQSYLQGVHSCKAWVVEESQGKWQQSYRRG